MNRAERINDRCERSRSRGPVVLDHEDAEQCHWTERGRAMSVANADALVRPRRSVRSFGIKY